MEQIQNSDITFSKLIQVLKIVKSTLSDPNYAYKEDIEYTKASISRAIDPGTYSIDKVSFDGIDIKTNTGKQLTIPMMREKRSVKKAYYRVIDRYNDRKARVAPIFDKIEGIMLFVKPIPSVDAERALEDLIRKRREDDERAVVFGGHSTNPYGYTSTNKSAKPGVPQANDSSVHDPCNLITGINVTEPTWMDQVGSGSIEWWKT